MTAHRFQKVLRLRYMQDFQCLGGECEDTCCGWWTIQIDQSHYVKLKRAMDKDPDDKRAFEAAFRLAEPSKRDRDHFALMVLQNDAYCRFLDGGKLCSLHQRFGEELLPDACATYPRAASIVGSRLEMSGEPSCPEVARHLLLSDEAIEVDDWQLPPNARVVPVQEMPSIVDDPYWGLIDKVRGVFYRVLSKRGYSATLKLYFAMFFAGEIDKVLRPGVKDFDESKVDREIEFIERPGVLDELALRFRDIPEPSPMPVSQIGQTLARIARGVVPETLYRLVDGVLSTYEGRGMRRETEDSAFILSPEPLHATYRALAKEREPKVKEALDLYFTNYLCHQVLHDWYTLWPNLFVYMQNVALRVAMLRFLLLSHPRFDEAANDRNKLDALAVEVFYLFSRALEHSKMLLDEASARLQEAMPTIADSFELLKV